jgi:hypothetical protein
LKILNLFLFSPIKFIPTVASSLIMLVLIPFLNQQQNSFQIIRLIKKRRKKFHNLFLTSLYIARVKEKLCLIVINYGSLTLLKKLVLTTMLLALLAIGLIGINYGSSHNNSVI